MSLEYLKKLAKERLRELRRSDPKTKLAAALLTVAREEGYPSWRALKAAADQHRTSDVIAFVEASAKGDLARMRSMLAADPSLARATAPARPHAGWTALHEAARRGQAAAVRLLLDHGADPHAREAGDHTYPLHWAAANGDAKTVRVLLDAGSDVHGVGDVHEMDVIGWATLWRKPGDPPNEAIPLLLDAGARHHIFSAMATGDLALIERLVEESPEALDRRQSRFERGLSPLHFAIDRKRYDILDLLIELGADLEAADDGGQTALAAALLRGDADAARGLRAAGALEPPAIDASSFEARMKELSREASKGVPMFPVPDIAKSLDWYTSIGFREITRYGEDGVLNFGMTAFGKAELLLMPGRPGPDRVTLWVYTARVDEIYQLLRARQFAGGNVPFEEDLYNPFYGGRQFSVRDPDGYHVIFYQE